MLAEREVRRRLAEFFRANQLEAEGRELPFDSESAATPRIPHSGHLTC